MDRKKISLQSQEGEDSQGKEEPNVQLSLTIPEHLKIRDQIQEISEISARKVLKAGKFIKVQEFKATINVYMTELNSQSFRVMLHYGNWKLEVSVIYTQIDERAFQDSKSLSGAFGVVKFVEFQGESYAVKGVPLEFDDGDIDLTSIYRQYFLCSLADSLQTGPKICPLFGYDILITKNKAFFAMEQCNSVKCNQMEIVEHQLLQNLKVLNSIKIIHNDIKPGNVAYSNYHNRHVFIDFGLSKIIKQAIGQKTNTKFVGTLSYCSEEMRKCYFLQTHKFVDLYENDLCCLKKTTVLMGRLKGQQNSSQDQLLLALEKQQPKILQGVCSVLRLRFHIQQSNLREVLRIVKSFAYKTTLYQIFQSSNISKKIIEDQEIQRKLIAIRNMIFTGTLNQNKVDAMLCNYFCENKKLMATERIIPVSQILESGEPDFLNKYLSRPDLILKLFHFFQPFSKNNHGPAQNKIELKKLIIDKIYEKTSVVTGPVFYWQKIRQTLVFFYENLKQFKDYRVLCWLRLLFISIRHFLYINQIQILILQSIHNQFLKSLKTAQFILFRAISVHDDLQTKNQKLHEYINTFFTQKNQHETYDLPITHLMFKIMSKVRNFSCTGQEKLEIIRQMKVIGEECGSKEERGVMGLVWFFCVELFRIWDQGVLGEVPNSIELKIYSNSFKQIKVNLNPHQQQQLKLFQPIRSEFTSLTSLNPSQDPNKTSQKAAIKNLLKIYKDHKKGLGTLCDRILELDFINQEILKELLQKIEEDLESLRSYSGVVVYNWMCCFDRFLEMLVKEELGLGGSEKMGKQQKNQIVSKLDQLFNKFIQKQQVNALISSCPHLKISILLNQTKLTLQKSKTPKQSHKKIQQISNFLHPLPYEYPKLVLRLLSLAPYFISVSKQDNYFNDIMLKIAEEYVRKGEFSIFGVGVQMLVDLVMRNNWVGEIWGNLDIFMGLMEYLRKKNQGLVVKSEHRVFLSSVQCFCSTLATTKMVEVYQQVKHKTIEFRCDMYAYFVFSIFMSIHEELHQAEKSRQVRRTTLCLKIMPPNTQLRIKSQLLKLYRSTIEFKTKRKAHICRKLEIRAITEDIARIKSFISDSRYKIQKISTKRVQQVEQKLLQRVSRVGKVMTGKKNNNPKEQKNFVFVLI